MFNWFKKKTVPPSASPTSEIPPALEHGNGKTTGHTRVVLYNPKLVPTLKAEHKHLLNTYMTVLMAVEKQDFAQVSQQLNQLDTILRAHLLKEHVELYVYLEYILTRGTHAFEEMHRLRLEMERISSEVTAFLNVYQTVPVNSTTATQFKQDFERIGAVLDKRILREETVLYPLYKPQEVVKVK